MNDYKINKYNSKLLHYQLAEQRGGGVGFFLNLKQLGKYAKVYKFLNGTLFITTKQQPSNLVDRNVTTPITYNQYINNDVISITQSGSVYVYAKNQIIHTHYDSAKDFEQSEYFKGAFDFENLNQYPTFETLKKMRYHPAMTQEEFEFMNKEIGYYDGLPEIERPRDSDRVRIIHKPKAVYDRYMAIVTKIREQNKKWNILPNNDGFFTQVWPIDK